MQNSNWTTHINLESLLSKVFIKGKDIPYNSSSWLDKSNSICLLCWAFKSYWINQTLPKSSREEYINIFLIHKGKNRIVLLVFTKEIKFIPAKISLPSLLCYSLPPLIDALTSYMSLHLTGLNLCVLRFMQPQFISIYLACKVIQGQF